LKKKTKGSAKVEPFFIPILCHSELDSESKNFNPFQKQIVVL
jgi:hypothetical protein